MGDVLYRKEAIANYGFEEKLISQNVFGNGHINDTFLLVFEDGEGQEKKFILQRINKRVFTRPKEVMENVVNVTSYLKKKIVENGGNPERETLNLISTLDGKPYYVDPSGEYWRVYRYIESASSYDRVNKPEDFYQSAYGFGNFQRLLSDFPAHTLHETIPGFHDTVKRFAAFQKAVEEDACGRGDKVRQEIAFALAHKNITSVLGDMLNKGELPLRVTHNDTKLNNVMIDNETGRAICVIDLDTVMPGLSVNDFGDSIRFGASTASEDEKDLDKVRLDLHLFEVYTKGFLEGCGGRLTEKEVEMFPMGALVMTYECGIRFLGDYLEGDHYYKIHYEEHNLDRARTQFKLVKEMEEKWEQMRQIVEKYSSMKSL